MRASLLSASFDGKGKNLKYFLLVHSQRIFHYNPVTAHVINAGLVRPTRSFSKWGMCNFTYLQRCSTILPYPTGTKMHSQQKKAISELSFITGNMLWVNYTLTSHPCQQDTTVRPSHPFHRLLNGETKPWPPGSLRDPTSSEQPTVALPGNEWPRQRLSLLSQMAHDGQEYRRLICFSAILHHLLGIPPYTCRLVMCSWLLCQPSTYTIDCGPGFTGCFLLVCLLMNIIFKQ